VPARVGPVDGIVVDVAVPVQTLGIAGIRDDRIGREEPSEGGVVVAGVMSVQAGRGGVAVKPLAVSGQLRASRSPLVADG
jgi:hypothetical protein